MLKYFMKNDKDNKRVVVVFNGLNCGSSVDLRRSWIVDYGATTHDCCERCLFWTYDKVEHFQAIMVGNGERVVA